MIPEEVDTLFNTHADFIANTRILSLAPLVKNIDLIRTEYSPHNDTTTERTTRDWTASLRDSDGSSWHCDVENGSDNREVKLLIPLENLEKARAALKLYKEKKT
jgi:predicted metal-dependent peptidase